MHAVRSVLAFGFTTVLAAGLLAGCGGVSNPSNNTVTTFNGTVTPDGQPTSYSFTASRNGEMSVRFTAIAPNSASLIGVAVGQQVSGGCSVFNLNNLTGLNRDVLIMPVNRGNYCLQVFNGGGVNAAQTYTVQVSHP
jgi:hypothetical protein